MGEPSQRARIVRVRALSKAVREVCLLPLDSRISFQPGQWVSLKLPIGTRPPLVRAYSMAEPETASGELVLAFDRVPGGLGSGYLFSLNEGDEVIVSGPYGNFVVPQPLSQDLLLIARYTGIVPIRCILKHLYAGHPSRKVALIYGAPSRAEQIYHDEFTALATGHDTFRYIPTVLGGQGQGAGESRSELELIASLGEDRTNVLPMVCGTKAFVRPCKAYLTERGFARKTMKVETYD